MTENKIIEKEKKFVVDYLKINKTADVCNMDFHEKFYQKFGGKRKETWYGAQPVFKAMFVLKELYNVGILMRSRIRLSRIGIGFPKWCYTYELKNKMKKENKQ